MSLIKSIYDELLERRLWPLALGLLVALVAVPLVLSKPAEKNEGQSAAPAPSASLLGRESASLLGETKPIVSLGGSSGFHKDVSRLARKNPFVQQARATKKAEGLTVKGGGAAIQPGGNGTTGGGTTGGGAPTTTPGTNGGNQPSPTRYQYTAIVKFGTIGKTSRKTLELTDTLPSEDNPVIIFLGSDGKSALFVASSGVTARGDGTCEPSESNCAVLRMKKDDVEFFEVAGPGDTVTTYELDLEGIGTKLVTSATRELSARQLPSTSSRGAQRWRQALRTKRIFNALGLLGP